jgi:hypothetical protein
MYNAEKVIKKLVFKQIAKIFEKEFGPKEWSSSSFMDRRRSHVVAGPSKWLGL